MFSYIELDKALDDRKSILKYYPNSVRAKLDRLIKDILIDPRNKIAVGRPEQLKYTEIETWSRELTKKDRIFYTIRAGSEYNMPDEEIVVFHYYLGHYDDK